MRGLENELFRLGIPTYIQSILVDLPTTAQLSINLPKQLPTTVGWIYGISTYADGKTPDNNDLITTANADALYLVLKAGQTEFEKSVRLADLLFTNSTGVGQRYLPVNIPYTISLDQSYLQNPTSIVSVATTVQVMINLWFIDWDGYATLRNSGYVLKNGIKTPLNK